MPNISEISNCHLLPSVSHIQLEMVVIPGGLPFPVDLWLLRAIKAPSPLDSNSPVSQPFLLVPSMYLLPLPSLCSWNAQDISSFLLDEMFKDSLRPVLLHMVFPVSMAITYFPSFLCSYICMDTTNNNPESPRAQDLVDRKRCMEVLTFSHLKFSTAPVCQRPSLSSL